MDGDSLALDDFIPYKLSIASNAASSLIARTYESLFGLNIPEWRIVAVLGESGPLAQHALAKRTVMDKMTLSRAARRLVQRRLVSRAQNADDARSYQLALTADGQRLLAAVTPAALALERAILADFSKDEVVLFKQLLSRLEAATARVGSQPLADAPI